MYVWLGSILQRTQLIKWRDTESGAGYLGPVQLITKWPLCPVSRQPTQRGPRASRLKAALPTVTQLQLAWGITAGTKGGTYYTNGILHLLGMLNKWESRSAVAEQAQSVQYELEKFSWHFCKKTYSGWKSDEKNLVRTAFRCRIKHIEDGYICQTVMYLKSVSQSAPQIQTSDPTFWSLK